jgi:hypothetical protein
MTLLHTLSLLLVCCSGYLSYSFSPVTIFRGLLFTNNLTSDLSLNTSSSASEVYFDGSDLLSVASRQTDIGVTNLVHANSVSVQVSEKGKDNKEDNEEQQGEGSIEEKYDSMDGLDDSYMSLDSDGDSKVDETSTITLKKNTGTTTGTVRGSANFLSSMTPHIQASKMNADNDIIPDAVIEKSYADVKNYINKGKEDIVKAGWKLVHENDMYTLFKRRSGGSLDGPVEYMMRGEVKDISPRVFLHSQVNKLLRKTWDKTMKEMVSDDEKDCSRSLDDYILEGNGKCEDKIYYRTKWPWPLKDRDYTLARKCHFVPDDNAIVFVSKAFSNTKFPEHDGVIRVNNYWCHSAYFSNKKGEADSTSNNNNNNNNAKFKGLKTSIKESTLHGKMHPVKDVTLIDSIPMDKSNREEGDCCMNHVTDVHSSSHAHKQGNKIFDTMKSHMPGLPALTNNLNGKLMAMANSAKNKLDGARSPLESPGTSFITIFCDDAKVPLPPRIIDMIAHQAEKQVPESMQDLYEAAKVQQSEN